MAKLNSRNGIMKASKTAPIVQSGKKIWTKNSDQKVAYTPLTQAQKDAEMRRVIKEMKDTNYTRSGFGGGSNDDLQKALSGKLKGV